MYDDLFSWNDLLFMLRGAEVSVAIAFVALSLGTILGAALGVIRAGAPWWINAPVGAVLDVFRSVPLLIQLVLFNSLNSMVRLDWSVFYVGSVTLGINAAAFCTEVVRGGILAVPSTTRKASRSLGLTWLQDMVYIVLPIAIRVILPSWIGLALGLLKDTSVVLWIGVIELLRSSQIVTGRVQAPLLVLFMAGMIYFALSFPIARMGARLERNWNTL